jgi:hypothetical protein
MRGTAEREPDAQARRVRPNRRPRVRRLHAAGRADHGQPRLWRMIAPELEGFYAERAAGRLHWKYFWFD